MAIVNVLFTVYGTIALKYSLNQLGQPRFDSLADGFDYAIRFLQSPLAVSAIFAFVIGAVFMMIAFSRMDVSIAYPAITGMNFLSIAIFSMAILGEDFSVNKLIGIALVLVSIYFFSR